MSSHEAESAQVALDTVQVIALLDAIPSGSKINVKGKQGSTMFSVDGFFVFKVSADGRDEYLLRDAKVPGLYTPFFAPGIEYTSITARAQSVQPQRRLTTLLAADELIPAGARTTVVSPHVAVHVAGVPTPTPATAPSPTQPESRQLDFLVSTIGELVSEMKRNRPERTFERLDVQPPQPQPSLSALEFAQALGQSTRGQNRPTWSLAGSQLSLPHHSELPWRVFVLAHYAPGSHPFPPTAALTPERWLVDYSMARSTLLPTLSSATFGDTKSGVSTVEAIHQELRLHERHVEQLVAVLHQQVTLAGAPQTKSAWFPFFYATAKLLALICTLRVGFNQGGLRILKSFETMWSDGMIDYEKLSSNPAKNFR
jgi:hypothetical protein